MIRGAAVTGPRATMRRAIGAAALLATALAAPARAQRPAGTSVVRVPLPARPYGVAVSPEGVVFVGRVDAADLTLFELPALTRVATVGLLGPAYDVISLPDAGTVYAVNVPAHAVSVIDRASLETVQRLDGLGEPFRVRATPEGAFVFVSTSSGALHRIASADDSLVTVRLAGVLNGLAVNAPRGVLYASATDGELFEVDLRTLALRRRATIGGRPQGMAVSRDGATLYLANEDGGAQVIDAATLALRTTIPGTEGAFDVALTPDGTQLYVTRSRDGVLAMVDVASGAVTRTWRGGQPRRMAFSPDGTVLVVANEAGWLTVIR